MTYEIFLFVLVEFQFSNVCIAQFIRVMADKTASEVTCTWRSCLWMLSKEGQEDKTLPANLHHPSQFISQTLTCITNIIFTLFSVSPLAPVITVITSTSLVEGVYLSRLSEEQNNQKTRGQTIIL